MRSPIICYGLGSAFHWTEEVLEKRLGVIVAAAIDADAARRQDDFRCPVWAPSQVSEAIADGAIRRDMPVVIAMGDPAACDQIARWLRSLGFTEVTRLVDLFEVHLGFQLDGQPAEQLRAAIRLQASRLERIATRLLDETSRTIFEQVGDLYLEGVGKRILSQPSAQTHFPEGIAQKIDYACVVRCGVDLSEIEDLLMQERFPIRELICFEPDPVQCHGDAALGGLLHAPVRRGLRNAGTRLSIHPFAVCARDGEARFYSAGLAAFEGIRKKPKKTAFGSRISSRGNCYVKTVALDTALRGISPTFLAVDAEGAELDILEGARQTLAEHRPALMIALYHRASHLWEVMDWLDHQIPGYRYCIRNYTGFLYETFLYAIADRGRGGIS